jgi:2-oxoglutarate ferredoxin oxidoreductase subunit gamma
MQEEFVFAGFGGQGVMFVGQLLAYAAMGEGFEVTWIPSYGPEMRGGTAHCFVVIGDKPIGSPITRQPKVAAVFNNPSFEKYEPLVWKPRPRLKASSL